MPILDKTRIEKMLAELRADMDPVKSFIMTRKVISHFIVLIAKEGSDAVMDLLYEALKKLEQSYDKINPGQMPFRDTFKAVDLLLELLKQYNTTRVASYVIDTVHYIITSIPAAALTRMHEPLVELFSNRLRQLYQDRKNGRVMMKCLQMLFQYICKFPSKDREEILADLIKSLAKEDDDQLLAIGKWKMQSIEQCSRSFANSMPGAMFYVLAVKSASCGGCNLKPVTGKVMHVEFNNVVSNYSFEALEENKESARLVVGRFADIQKYKVKNDKNGLFVDIQLKDAAMRFEVIYAEDLLELRQFLSPLIGDREENAATSLDMVITHIRFDESSVFNRECVRNASVEPSVMPEDTRLILEPSACTSIELHDTTAPSSIRALEQERDVTREKDAGNGHVNPVTDDNGGARTDLDPYDINNIRDEDSLAPSTSGGKRGRGSRTAKNAPPSNRRTNKKNEPLPSLVKSIAQHRAQKSTTNGYDRSGRSGSANCKARNNTVPIQSMSEDDDVENYDRESDDSWHPEAPRKAPPVTSRTRGRGKGPGRRESVMSFEKITSFPCNNDLAANSDCVESNSSEMYEMLQQIQKNHIFDSHSSTSSASIGKKRKSRSNENAKNQGTFVEPSATNDGMWANKRFASSPGSMMDVAPGESAHGEMDLRPQDSSNISFQQPCGMDLSMDQASSKSHYVLHHIIIPNIKECKEIRQRNMANGENYLNPILNARRELLDTIRQKAALIMQHLQAANEGFEELDQLNLEFNRGCPSDSELEQRIREAEDDDNKLTEKMKNDKIRIEKVIQEAITDDWKCVAEAYAKQVYAVFNANK
uniref:Uncharacterized protein n=1 Tax=Anopheles atroparvus TaxID=41427 RepID=A0A182JFR9_ANOAO